MACSRRPRLCDILIIIQLIIILWPKFTRSTLLANSSFISRRNADLYSGAATDAIDRQYPTDVTFLLPHLIVGLLIPIAVIIGIGVVLMKMFIIGFWFLGKGGYGMLGQQYPVYSPWRVDQFSQQRERSLLGRDGNKVPSYLSPTLWNLIEKVSSSLEKFEKYTKT